MFKTKLSRCCSKLSKSTYYWSLKLTFFIIKASVHYFLSNIYFSPNDSYLFSPNDIYFTKWYLFISPNDISNLFHKFIHQVYTPINTNQYNTNQYKSIQINTNQIYTPNLFHQMIFISPNDIYKKYLFSPNDIYFSPIFHQMRYLNFCIFVFPSFFPCQPLL